LQKLATCLRKPKELSVRPSKSASG
jgi:hypothetical protein